MIVLYVMPIIKHLTSIMKNSLIVVNDAWIIINYARLLTHVSSTVEIMAKIKEVVQVSHRDHDSIKYCGLPAVWLSSEFYTVENYCTL